ncbi:methyl-accepting chemotaxis protein [Aquabacterium sp. A3]|uniref:methyl-accepting chemotaxis protein n=1 Tax=Aquabacterium sp. A3 TaxID=3132829 RepID=UPI00311999F4
MHTSDTTARPAQQRTGHTRPARLADFFRYHGLWAPGVRLFRRLHFRAKALILSAMFIIPIVLLSWQYFGDKQAMIDFTRGERLGVEALHAYIAVQQALVEIQATEAAAAHGLPGAQARLTQLRAGMQASLAHLAGQARQHGDPMALTPVVDELSRRWQNASTTRDPALQAAMHAALQAVLDQIGDASGLVLDPDLDSFYLMKTLVFSLPAAMNDLGYLWSAGAVAAASGPAPAERQREWQVAEAQYNAAWREVKHAYTRAIKGNTALQTQLDDAPLGGGESLYVSGRGAILGTAPVSLDAYVAQGQAAVQEVVALYQRTLPLLDDLLAQRESRLQQAMVGTASVLVISLLVAWYLFLSFRKVLEGGLNEVAFHIDAMRDGDLTTEPRAWGGDEAARLMITLKDMQAALKRVVSEVRGAADTIVHASQEIAAGSTDLSNRTAQSAGRLQQSASAMETVSATVEQTAQSAAQASMLADTNAQAASSGGQIISSVIETMSEIQGASRQINDIVGTIDGIAFQTNILALNAAVEAARAGEQGRGFAVVASEVRALAQRTSTAAREVKRLIGTSVDKVDAGGAVVRQAGESMQAIVAHAQQVNALLAEIASGARDQATGVQQTAQAVQALDGATQQNAALVEQTAAAAASLREQAQRLAQGVAVFKLA